MNLLGQKKIVPLKMTMKSKEIYEDDDEFDRIFVMLLTSFLPFYRNPNYDFNLTKILIS